MSWERWWESSGAEGPPGSSLSLLSSFSSRECRNPMPPPPGAEAGGAGARRARGRAAVSVGATPCRAPGGRAILWALCAPPRVLRITLPPAPRSLGLPLPAGPPWHPHLPNFSSPHSAPTVRFRCLDFASVVPGCLPRTRTSAWGLVGVSGAGWMNGRVCTWSWLVHSHRAKHLQEAQSQRSPCPSCAYPSLTETWGRGGPGEAPCSSPAPPAPPHSLRPPSAFRPSTREVRTPLSVAERLRGWSLLSDLT